MVDKKVNFMPLNVIVPLKIEIHNLGSFKKIGDFKIRRITPEEIKKHFGIVNLQIKGTGISYEKINQHKVVDTFFDINKNIKIYTCGHIIEAKHTRNLKDDLSNLLLAFRLYKEGEIIAPVILNEDGSGGFCTHPPFVIDNEKYEIDVRELNEVERIYKLIKNNKIDKLKLALKRFKNAISAEGDKKNSFIDFITILESLFLKNESQEVSFRFSLYISFLLKKIGLDTTFEEIKRIYITRSQLVHSGRSNNYNSDMLFKIKNYTRELLLWYLEEDEEIDVLEDIIELLED